LSTADTVENAKERAKQALDSLTIESVTSKWIVNDITEIRNSL
jgi:predicted RNase H-like HicB family nuclease